MISIFAIDSFFNPQLSLTVQTLIRVAYGVLLLGTLILAAPNWRQFFCSERWGGYTKSSPVIDRVQNPISISLIIICWFACAILLISGRFTIWAAFANLLICRYFFIHLRWQSILRGMGAPGFMTYWLGASVFLLELTTHLAPGLRSLALLVLQVDFALIILSAGIYKFKAGYAHNQGMESGLVNPQWSYWCKFYEHFPPSHPLFKILNHSAWVTQMLSAILMLLPPTRFIGGVLVLFSFMFITTQIRLGLLCEMVMVSCLLFFHPGSLGERCLHSLNMFSTTSINTVSIPWLNILLGVILSAYLILLPLAHVGLFYNFYKKKPLPALVQNLLERYTNFFGIIIWRVFSADLVNFFVLIYDRQKTTQKRTLISRYGRGFRYSHVGESITITSLFTTLKYYPTNTALFQERLLRYARTIPCPLDSVLEFEYVSINKSDSSFKFVTTTVYTVDIVASTISKKTTDRSNLELTERSPIHEAIKPGSYVPLSGEK